MYVCIDEKTHSQSRIPFSRLLLKSFSPNVLPVTAYKMEIHNICLQAVLFLTISFLYPIKQSILFHYLDDVIMKCP